jgi:hypothetical protein
VIYTIDYNEPLKDLIKRVITPDHHRLQRSLEEARQYEHSESFRRRGGTEFVQMRILEIEAPCASRLVRSQITHAGVLPNVRELLVYGGTHPEAATDHPVIAFGSEYFTHGYRHVTKYFIPCLTGSPLELAAVHRDEMFGPWHRFLVVTDRSKQ